MKRRQERSSYNNLPERGNSIDHAVEFLRHGRIVAFPTETYYGLAVDPENGQAVERLYQLKNRPENKPLLLLAESRNSIENLIKTFPKEYEPLVEKHWPGPLTLIFPAADSIHPRVTSGTGTVGIRISPHPVAAGLVASFGRAITATSANLSGHDPATQADEVAEMFGTSIDYILDGGRTTAGLCSTIVSIEDASVKVVRKGVVDPFS